MSARDTGAAVAQEARMLNIRRIAAQASCLTSMLESVEFIVGEERKIEMMIEVQNFAEDIMSTLSELLRPEAS